MNAMPKEHKLKIDKALEICEEKFKSFLSSLEKVYSKEEAGILSYFLLENTVFAGGVFRSVFTGYPIHDIDIFFTSQDSVLEFKDRFLRDDKVFKQTDISKNGSFNWKSKLKNELGKNVPLSFITYHSDEPSTLISNFDFSFNQHYFSLNDYDMQFDVDTFSMKGKVHNAIKEPLNVFLRAMKFMNQGLKVDQNSMLNVAEVFINSKDSKRAVSIYDLFNQLDTSYYNDTRREANPLGLTYKTYSQEDYFNLELNKKKIRTVYDLETAAMDVNTWANRITNPLGQTQLRVPGIRNANEIMAVADAWVREDRLAVGQHRWRAVEPEEVMAMTGLGLHPLPPETATVDLDDWPGGPEDTEVEPDHADIDNGTPPTF